MVVDAENARGAGGLSAPTASSHLDNADQSVAIGNTLILSSNTSGDTRADRPRRSARAAIRFNWANRQYRGRRHVRHFVDLSYWTHHRTYQVVNNLSHQAGAHALRVGADFLYNDDLITFPRSVRGSYTFASLANFLSGTYNNAGFSQTFGATDVAQTNPNLGIYAQDSGRPPDVSPSTPAFATICSSSRRSPPTPTTCRRASASPGRPRNHGRP